MGFTAPEVLLWAIPLGLAVDIAGFLVVVRFGHSLFIRTGTGPPSDEGKDGDLYLG